MYYINKSQRPQITLLTLRLFFLSLFVRYLVVVFFVIFFPSFCYVSYMYRFMFGDIWAIVSSSNFLPILTFVFFWKSLLRLLIFHSLEAYFSLCPEIVIIVSLKSLVASPQICIILYLVSVDYICLFWELVTFSCFFVW